MKTVIKTEIYDRFHCIGSECPSTCCGGNVIKVEKEASERLKKIEGKYGDILKSCIKYSESTNSDVITHNERNMCPLLNEQQLCSLVIEYGEEILCETCKKFPRRDSVLIINESGDKLNIKTVMLGCPYVVELLDKYDKKIEEFGEDGKDIQFGSDISKNAACFIGVRQFISDLAQNENFPLWFREFLCAYVLEKISRPFSEGDTDKVYNTIDRIFSEEYLAKLYEGVSGMPVNVEQQFQTLCGFMNEILRAFVSQGLVDKNKSREKLARLADINLNCTFDEWNEARKEWKEMRNEELETKIIAYLWLYHSMGISDDVSLLEVYFKIFFMMCLIRHLEILSITDKEQFSCNDWNDLIIPYIGRAVGLTNDDSTVERAMKTSLLSVPFIRILADFT